MKIKKASLVEIIREELLGYLSEVGMCHSPTTGFFSNCQKGNVYSLTRKAADDNKIDKKYALRGTVTSKEKREPPKLKSPFGLNTSKKKSGGRKTIAGDDINPVYSVSKYPDKYQEELDRLKSFPDRTFGVDELVGALTILEEDADELCKRCAPCQSKWQAGFLRALNRHELASQGKLNKPKKRK